MATNDFKQRLSDYRSRVELALDKSLNKTDMPPRLQDAMAYSCLNGGKRVRALLVYAAGESVNAPLEKLDAVATSLECIHSYSLIHDDLPAMDDDDLRRGKPTNHKAYDEATAILAGDALLTVAFDIICNEESPLDDQQARKISALLSSTAGACGMVGGQMLDIQATQQSLSLNDLENMHRRKTGALIRAAVVGGALCADSDNSDNILKLEKYADDIGLAFQVIDDILDIEASTEILGKAKGADENLGKATYPSVIGLDASKELAQKLYQEAVESISSIGDNTSLLIGLANLVVTRKK